MKSLVPRTNDVVLHRVTGETWVVAFVEGGYLAPCGWPMCLVPVSECDVITRSTDEASEQLLRNLAAMQDRDDPRRQYAARVLAEGT